MNKVLVIALVTLVGMGLYMSQMETLEHPLNPAQNLQMAQKNNLYKQFSQWKMQFSKIYSSKTIDSYRFKIFIENLEHILSENRKGHSYTLGQTQFMDLTKDEFLGIYLRPIHSDSEEIDDSMPEINGSVDWTTKGVVSKVKDQGQCGSCWAFSATGVVESYWKINKGTLPSLSEQQLVDCSTANYGCDGGWPYKALAWVKANGLTTESAYPYKAKDGTCTIKSGAYKIPAYYTGSGCTTLTNDIIKQPTSVCVDASNWSFYKSGIFSNCGKSTNHAVLATGYDNNGNWLIKNSWGTSWGNNGYITLRSGNTCAVCSQLANVK